MTYETYKAEVIKLVKGHYLKVWPEAEVDEFLKNEEAYIMDMYQSDIKKPQYLQSGISGTAYGLGMMF